MNTSLTPCTLARFDGRGTRPEFSSPFSNRRSTAPRQSANGPDEALIKAIARGDRDAMRLLYGRYSTRVYRFALRLVGDTAAAEDVVSEVFLDVWRGAGGFAGRSEVATWILAITRHKAMQFFRRRRFEPLDDATSELIEDDSDGPETVLQKKQAGPVLIEALQHLSLAHREIIDLVYYHDRSTEEVARILNIPISTVKTRMFYARKQLARLLAEAGQDRSLLASRG